MINLFTVKIGILLCVLLNLANMALSNTEDNSQKFSLNLFHNLVANAAEKNVIFSPLSIQSCMAMAFLGAKGQTAEELRKGLLLGNDDAKVVSKNYGNFLAKAFASKNAKGPQLKLANRIYVNEGLEILPEVKNLAQNHFKSDIKTLPFSNSTFSVNKINTWVEQSTNGQIKNLMPADGVSEKTGSVMVNAIYFKGKWQEPFSEGSTRRADFSVNAVKKVPVDMMHNYEVLLNYTEIPELDSAVVEMPYENSDMSMLIILPNKIDGLQQLEQKLAFYDFNTILQKLEKHEIDLFLPKFKIEFEVDLKTPLQQLGIKTIFTDDADLSAMFAGSGPLKISEVRHKAFLDVNEAGTEAAAATFYKEILLSMNLSIKRFHVDHPFVFVIRNKNAIYYAGHVVNI